MAAAQPADLGERVYAPELLEENEYYMRSFMEPGYTRVTVLGVEPSEVNNNAMYVLTEVPDSDIPRVLGTTATDNQYFRFWKIQGYPYGPPNRNYLRNRVAPKNLEPGRNYYMKDGHRRFKRITINKLKEGNPSNIVYVYTRPEHGEEYGHVYGTGPSVDSKEKFKFYKAADVMYKENAARVLFPHMMAYFARPPGTMGPENTGGRVYELWKRQFEGNRGGPGGGAAGSRRRRTRRQTRRRR